MKRPAILRMTGPGTSIGDQTYSGEYQQTQRGLGFGFHFFFAT